MKCTCLVPTFVLVLVPALVLGAPQAPSGGATTIRFALVAGANRGADDRQVLRFAVSDASRFALVMLSSAASKPRTSWS